VELKLINMETGNYIFLWALGNIRTLFNTRTVHIVTQKVEKYGLKIVVIREIK